MVKSNNKTFSTKNEQNNGTPLIKCLTECNKGEETIVLRVDVGSKQKKRLADLGLVPGTKIKKKTAAPFHGPLEIIVSGSNIVIGRELASKITVKCSGTCSL